MDPSDANGDTELLRHLTKKLRRRNAEQTVAFKDVFMAHEGLLQLNAKLKQQTLEQDKVDITALRTRHCGIG